MSSRQASSNISIASLNRDRKEPFIRSRFPMPGQARYAVPKLMQRSAAPLKKRRVPVTSIENNNHASPLVRYHEEPPSNEHLSPIPFQTSPEEDDRIMFAASDTRMEDFKRLMDGAFLEAQELPNLDIPSDIDVLCHKGGGKKVVAHPGNKYYSKLIKEAAEQICDKPDEGPGIYDLTTAARIIVKQIRSRNGRFLCKDYQDNSPWWDIGDGAAVRKTILRLKKAQKQALENETKAKVEKKAKVPPVEPTEPHKSKKALGTWSLKTVEDVMKVLVIPPRPSPRTETLVWEPNRKSSVRSSSSSWSARKGSKSNAAPKRHEPQSRPPSPVASSSHSLLRQFPRGQYNASPDVPSPPVLSRGRSRSFENIFIACLDVSSPSNLEPSPRRDLSSRPKLKRTRSSSLPNMRQKVTKPPGSHSYHGTEEPVPMAAYSSSAFENVTVWDMAEHLRSQDSSSNLYGSV